MQQTNFKVLTKSVETEVDVISIFQATKSMSHKDYRVLLESSESGNNGRQQSMLLLDQALKVEARGFQVTISALNDNGLIALKTIQLSLQSVYKDETSTIIHKDEKSLLLLYPDNRMLADEDKRIKRNTPLDAIRLVLSILSAGNESVADKLIIAGVVGYDIVDSLELLTEVEDKSESLHGFPDYMFLLSDRQIIIDQNTHCSEIREIIFTAPVDSTNNSNNGFSSIESRITKAQSNLDSLENLLINHKKSPTIEKNIDENNELNDVVVSPNNSEFLDNVATVKEAISKGQVFQTVISRNFKMQCSDTLLAYQYLRKQNPSPYQFYLELKDYTLLGASPESSLRYQQVDRTISIMPIAGTRGRGRHLNGDINEELDARLEIDLKLDEKELAEHLMLVDLARNDLARISKTGSRKVRELMSVYKYEKVMHMVSRIDATLRSDLDIFHACQACFHMGTLTGAPKVEAMNLIRKIENRRRETYGGAVGYYTGSGDMDTAIIIRSALVKNGIANITSGAGVVADSIPELELKETELKAAAVISAIKNAENIKSLSRFKENCYVS